MYIVICEHNVPSSFIDFMHSNTVIRVFNCLSIFSLKPEYTPKFSKSLKLEKSAKPEYPPPQNFKIPKNGKNAELYPPMLNTDRQRWRHGKLYLIFLANFQKIRLN